MQTESEQPSLLTTASPEDSSLYMGDTWMDEKGIIFVQLDDAPPEEPPTIHEPGSADYDTRIEHAQGLRPGEKKRLPRVVGFVDMNADRSLRLTKILLHPNTSPAFPMETILPSDTRYRYYLSLIPPIEPGKTRLILAPVLAARQ